MGTIVHNSIIVTGAHDRDEMHALKHKAMKLFPGQVTSTQTHVTNGECSFLIVSSGSKNGWQDKTDHEDATKIFLAYAELMGNWVEIILVEHGETTPQVTEQ